MFYLVIISLHRIKLILVQIIAVFTCTHLWDLSAGISTILTITNIKGLFGSCHEIELKTYRDRGLVCPFKHDLVPTKCHPSQFCGKKKILISLFFFFFVHPTVHSLGFGLGFDRLLENTSQICQILNRSQINIGLSPLIELDTK